MVPAPELLERFAADLEALTGAETRIGIAVSGGPDSLALLLLAAAARLGNIEAATVDHALRATSEDEARMVAGICEQLGVPHRILTIEWPQKPRSAVQERARAQRYRLLGRWAADRGLAAIVTAHHLDDQAETLVMRLARGAGVRGLGGMRPRAKVPGAEIPLLRPLLGWRRHELAAVCRAAGLTPVADPSNADARFERVRVRRLLGDHEHLNAGQLAASAAHLADADAALEWATRQEWGRAVTNGGGEIVYRPSDAPGEIRRRIVAMAVSRLATEGAGAELRGRELDRLVAVLGRSGVSTIRGVRCSGGSDWRFAVAPARRG